MASTADTARATGFEGGFRVGLSSGSGERDGGEEEGEGGGELHFGKVCGVCWFCCEVGGDVSLLRARSGSGSGWL